jgi:hypothetical protein
MCNNDIFSDCYSLVADIECQLENNNNALDKLFYQDRCQTVTEICTPLGMNPVNASFCTNATAYVPMSDIITRVLSSEEFF